MKHTLLSLYVIVATTSLFAQVWQQTNGPSGNKIKKIVFNQKKDMVVLSSALLRTTDHGASWRQIGGQFRNGSIRTVAFSATGDLYAIVDPVGMYWPDSTSGLWKSTNDGETWVRIFKDHLLTNVTPSPDGAIHIFDYHFGDLLQHSFRSFDQGVIWDSALVASDRYFTTSEVDANGDLFYCTDNQGYRSCDRGATWSKIYGISAGRFHDVSCSPNGDVYLSGIGTPYGLYRSVDRGLMWTRKLFPNSEDSHLQGTVVSPTGRVLFIGGYGPMYSDDRGDTWKTYCKLSNELGEQAPTLPAAADPDSGFYVTMCGTVVKMSTPGNWEVMSAPISSVQTLFCSTDGSVLASTIPTYDYGTYCSELWRSTSGGARWDPLFIKEPNQNPVFSPTCIERDSNNTIIAAAEGMIYGSDDGSNWNQKTATKLINGTVNAIVATSNRRLFLATSSDGMLLSPDNGELWWPVNSGLSSMNVTAAAVAKDNTLFAALTNKLYQSKDNGANWQEISSGVFTGKIFKLISHTDGSLYAGVAGQGIFRSADQGATWTPLGNQGLTSIAFTALLLANDGSVVVSNDNGIYRFSGGMWTPFGEGCATKAVTCLAQDVRGRLYAGTAGAGVLINEKLVSKTERTTDLHGITIHYATPNPASEVITYGFTCGESIAVTISLYDVTGKRLSTLVDDRFAPGDHIFTLPAASLSPGMYMLGFTTPYGVKSESIVIR